MAQYQVGTASVTQGTNIVTGVGTSWLSKVSVGDTFKVYGVAAIYGIISVDSDTQIKISPNYAGISVAGSSYQLTTDWTPNLGLAEIHAGDSEFAFHLTQEVIRKLDARIGQSGILVGEASTQVQEDALFAQGYTFVIRTDLLGTTTASPTTTLEATTTSVPTTTSAPTTTVAATTTAVPTTTASPTTTVSATTTAAATTTTTVAATTTTLAATTTSAPTTTASPTTTTLAATTTVAPTTTTVAATTTTAVPTTTTTTVAPDTSPNAFTFVDQTGVALSTVTESAAITVAGINSPAAISIVDGEYNINGGVFVSVSGTVSNGDVVKVRLISSASNSTAASTTLTIGGVSDTFTVTTAAAGDTTPDAFSFIDQTNVPLSTLVESNTITVSGINAPTNLSISGGEYSKNAGAWASANTTVVNGDTIKVRRTSSATPGTTGNVVVLIGGVGDTFSVTTLAAPTAPVVITVTPNDTTSLITLTSGGTGATSYELKYRVSGGSFGAYSTVTLPHTQTGLVNGTTYGFILKAINAGGSVESAEVSGTPVAAGNYSDTSFDGAANNATSFGGWTTFVGSNATSAISTAEGHTSAPSWGLSAGNGEEAGYGALRRTITTDTRNMTFWYKSDLGSIDQGTLRVKQGVALKAEHTILTTPELFDGDWHQVPAPLTAGTNAVIEISIDSFGGGGWVDDISIPVP